MKITIIFLLFVFVSGIFAQSVQINYGNGFPATDALGQPQGYAPTLKHVL